MKLGIRMVSRRMGQVAGICLLIVLVVGPFARADVPMTGQAVSGMSSVDNVIQTLMGDWDVPGMAVAIVKDGRLVFARGYGYANESSGTKVQPDSLFRIASVSKPITAVTILDLVEQGKLSLSDKAFDILDDLEPPTGESVDSRLANVTIEHLLTHSAGWDINQLGYDPMFDLHKTAADALGEAEPADAEAIIRYMMGETMNFTPGSRYTYSNLGYSVLAGSLKPSPDEATRAM